MSWNIPVKKKVQPIPSIRWGRDSGVFFSLLIMIYLLFTLFYYITHNSDYFYYAFAISLSVFMAFIIYIGLRLFQLGVSLERNELISTESSNIDYEWSEWASDYISIVDYSYLFPEESQIPHLLEVNEFNAIGTRALHFSESIDYTVLFHELLAPMRARLIEITSEKGLVINFIIGQMSGISAWQPFLLAWKRLGLSEDIIKNSEFILHDYVLNINEWLSVTEDKFRLIIVGEKSTDIKDNHHRTGDGMCAFLFAPPVLVNQNNSVEKARLYRSISTNEGELFNDLNDLIFYQAKVGIIDNLLIGKYSDKKDVAKVAVLLNEHNNNLEQYYAELYIGIHGEFDIWMMLMFSLLNGKNVSAVDLIFSESNGKIILSRVKKIRNQE
ncbi:hypothetical protein CO701_01690 [Citrobacter werkmanii]|uniref:hypothetical protein n=1 Tax=Citrobacter sp. wls711 TaxID=2576425 RepID=UPI000BBD0477|nr:MULTISPECIES: hypothetical protein [Citrobacter]HEE0107520.1 hypothetical protein [Citrobacter gillenii]ATF47950.1 hypothetical protein CO701_01690 [Citrobacter werkmanii]QLO05702.1 hypothetical protein HV141_20220 [Citrobacter freundii]QLU68375.1 hypothetical protein HV173_20300 [Citrobacter freundii]TKU59047.1 hypothetical protein FDW98_15950 [Citrobacter sp. wls711]